MWSVIIIIIIICAQYLQTTVQQMSEAWEDILMEMDSKLLKFAEDKRVIYSMVLHNDDIQ